MKKFFWIICTDHDLSLSHGFYIWFFSDEFLMRLNEKRSCPNPSLLFFVSIDFISITDSIEYIFLLRKFTNMQKENLGKTLSQKQFLLGYTSEFPNFRRQVNQKKKSK